MGAGLIISETEPELINRYTWCKPFADGSKEWYEPSDGGWMLVRTDTAPAEANHSHSTHGDINFTGTVSADGDAGLTGTRTIDGHTLTFKNGILVGYEAP